MRVILENKNREIEILQKRFPYDKNLINNIFNLDPTYDGYYSQFISKTLPKYIIKLSDERGGLNVASSSSLLELYSLIRWFDINKKHFSTDIIEKFIESYEREYSESDILKEPKNIYSYPNLESIKRLKSFFETKMDKQNYKNIIKSQVSVLYEDGDTLVVEPNSFEASKYYGFDQWYISCDNCSSTFAKVKNTSRIVFFIDKNNPQGKIMLVVSKKEKDIKILTDTLDIPEIGDLYDIFPKTHELIDDLIGRSNFLKDLKLYANNQLDANEINDEEEGMSFFLKKTKNPNKELSYVILKFNDDLDYFKLFNLDDSDIDFVNKIYGYYSPQFYDPYYSSDEFREGRISYVFNEENYKKFIRVVKTLMPEIDEDNYDEEVYDEIRDNFEMEVNDITYEYSSYYNDALVDGNKEYLEKVFGDKLFEYGIYKKNVYSEYFTTVGNLLELYEKKDKKGIKSLYKLISDILSEDNKGSYNLWDNYYEIDVDRFFDKERFNRSVSNSLDSILEKLEDMSENEELKFTKELNQKVLSKYRVGSKYELPTEKNVYFRIIEVLRDDKKILVQLIKDHTIFEKMKLSIEEFFQLINTYRLFK
jgi:hypothetical protein